MKFKGLTALGVASAAAIAWHAPAMADDSIEERLSKMEQRIEYLEERVASQDQVIVEKEREIAALSGQTGDEDAWFNRVEIFGVIELEAGYTKPYDDPEASDIDRSSSNTAEVAKVELGIAAQINDWTGSEVVVKYNSDDGDMELDAATVTFAPPEGPWSLTGGSQVLPFGVYETNLISDPLTLQLGETGENSLVFGLEAGDFYGSLYAFDGDNQVDGKQRIGGHGASVGYAMEGDGFALDLNAGWINDIGDSDGVGDALAESLDGLQLDTDGDGELEDIYYSGHVAGMSASALLSVGDLSVIGEYVSAVEEFEAHEIGFQEREAEPSAWSFEAAYGFELADTEATVAVSYQTSDEAIALGLPESRTLGGISVGIMENVGLGVEWARDDDYSMEDGGTGKSADTVTVQLGAEF